LTNIIIGYNFIFLMNQPKAPTIAANGDTHKGADFTGAIVGGRVSSQGDVL
jgi:hypothetical protein